MDFSMAGARKIVRAYERAAETAWKRLADADAAPTGSPATSTKIGPDLGRSTAELVDRLRTLDGDVRQAAFLHEMSVSVYREKLKAIDRAHGRCQKDHARAVVAGSAIQGLMVRLDGLRAALDRELAGAKPSQKRLRAIRDDIRAASKQLDRGARQLARLSDRIQTHRDEIRKNSVYER